MYDEREAEGILVGVRGSKTLLQGTSSGRHLSVLGLVALPAFTSSFVTLQDVRTIHSGSSSARNAHSSAMIAEHPRTEDPEYKRQEIRAERKTT
jgi:hypothetical protein